MNPSAKQAWQWFVTVAVLASLAVAQPLYSKLGEQAEFFVAHGLTAAGLLMLCLALSVLIPAALGILPVLARSLGSTAAKAVFLCLVASLAWLIALPALAPAGLDGHVAVLTGFAIAGLVTVAYEKTAFVRLVLVWLAPSILVFPLAFLLFSRASAIVLPTGQDAAASAGPARHHVVFLVLDEFPLVSLLTPELEIDRQLYPNFARLQDLSHWFAGASSGAEGTVIAVPSALTGLAPVNVQGKLPLLGNFPDNLFTRLQQSHAIHAQETATLLCPREVCREGSRGAPGASLSHDLWIVWQHIVTPRRWADRLPPLANAWAGFGRRQAAPAASEAGLQSALAVADWAEQQDWYQRSEQFRAFIRAIQPADRPQLHYLHTLLPHAPWNYLPDGRQYAFGENSLAAGLTQGVNGVWYWTGDPWPVWQAWQRHLLQVQYLDGLVGQLLDHLIGLDLLDETLLVVMGDHGGAFVPGNPRREVTRENVTDLTAVPLFVKLPGQREGHRHDRDARLEDVLPTVLHGLGQAPRGASLLTGQPAASRGPIQVWGRAGLALSYTHEEHIRHLAARARSKAALFGSEDGSGFYAIGPESGLLGTPAPEMAPGASAPLVEIEGRQLYRGVDPAAGFVPRLVRGRLLPVDTGSRQALAIAINGVIRATTWAIDGHFSALLGPGTLRPGANELGVYMIADSTAGARLSALRQPAGGIYTLTGPPGGERIRTPDGASVPVAPGSPGIVSSIAAEGDSLHYLTGRVPAELGGHARIVAFRGNAAAAAGETDDENRFFNLPVNKASGTGRVRVFVIPEDGRHALEYDYSDACRDAFLFRDPGQADATNCEIAPATPLILSAGRWQTDLEFGGEQVSGLLGAGWGDSGSGVRWTIGKSARLRIPLPADDARLRFRAQVRPFLAPPKLPRQELWLLANGEPAGRWDLDQPDFQTIEWIVEPGTLALESGQLDLRFLIPNAQAPRALGVGADARAIGVAFLRLEISELPGESP